MKSEYVILSLDTHDGVRKIPFVNHSPNIEFYSLKKYCLNYEEYSNINVFAFEIILY